MKVKGTALLVILTTILIITLTQSLTKVQKESDNQESSQNNLPNHHEYVIRAKDNSVYLYDGNTVIKEYEINPLLLPSEDYEMLLNGISAQSIENADMLAEDFDG